MSREQRRRTMHLAFLLGDGFQADERPGDDDRFRCLWSRDRLPAQLAWDLTRFVGSAEEPKRTDVSNDS